MSMRPVYEVLGGFRPTVKQQDFRRLGVGVMMRCQWYGNRAP